MPGNGHCLFQAVAFYTPYVQADLRKKVAKHLKKHLKTFHPFIENLGERTIEDYISDVKVGKEWAGNVEIKILMQVLKRPIVIIGPEGMIRNPADIEKFINNEPIFVYYNDHNHYDAFLVKLRYSASKILEHLRQDNERSSGSEIGKEASDEEKHYYQEDKKQKPRSQLAINQESDSDTTSSDEEKRNSQDKKLRKFLNRSTKRVFLATQNQKNYIELGSAVCNVGSNSVAALNSPTIGTGFAIGTICLNLAKDLLTVKKHQNRINNYEEKLGEPQSSVFRNYPIFIIGFIIASLALLLMLSLRVLTWTGYEVIWTSVLIGISAGIGTASILPRKLNNAFTKDRGDKKFSEIEAKKEQKFLQDMSNKIREEVEEEFNNRIQNLKDEVDSLKLQLKKESTEHIHARDIESSSSQEYRGRFFGPAQAEKENLSISVDTYSSDSEQDDSLEPKGHIPNIASKPN